MGDGTAGTGYSESTGRTGDIEAGDSVTFGAWLKQRRKAQGISPRQFARLVGCSSITLLKIEAGERRPSRQLSELIADNLNIDGDEREQFIVFARLAQPVEISGASSFAARAPWRAAHSRHTNLPAALTSFVGREEEVDAIRRRLLQWATRLLTLTGPPGIGKTRLALEVASGLVGAGALPDGVFLVDMAPVSDPDMLPAAVVRALGVEPDGAEPVEAALLKYLAGRRMLLVLDNMEHLLDAAPFVVKMLEVSPWLRVLATSREALHVRGERRQPVAPLRTPNAAALPPLAELGAYPSVALFLERAEASSPEFALTAENAADVAAICVALDGLPLALELAASRMEQYSPSEVRADLATRLLLSAKGRRDLPLRQLTLRAAIAWSYELLTVEERRLLRLLGAFVGGANHGAVEALYGGGEQCAAERSAERSPEELLLALVDKNLIMIDRQAGEVRYIMLQVIREFAIDKLREEGETEQVRHRHALYYRDLVERADAGLQGADHERWLQRLEAEHDNLRAAFNRVDESGDVETGLRIAGALWRFWEWRDYDKEGERLLQHFVAQGRQPGLEAPYAKALIGAGTLSYKLGNYESALHMLQESLDVYRALGDRSGASLALRSLGQLYRYSGRIAEALLLVEESLSICKQIGDRSGVAGALYVLGVLRLDRHEYEQAGRLLGESLEIRRKLGEKTHVSKTLVWLGEIARSRGDYETAYAHYNEALSLGYIKGLDLAYLLHNIGHVALHRGDYARAGELFAQSLEIGVRLEDKEAAVACLAGLAAVACCEGRAERAATLFGAAEALIAALDVHLDTADRLAYEQNRARARADLDTAAWQAAHQAGVAMSLEEAIAYSQRA